MSIKNTVSRMSLILCLGALTACGLGGGGSDSIGGSNGTTTVTPPSPPTGNTFSLNGTATKGTIFGGTVEVQDAANPATILATGETNSTIGGFDLSIPASANFTGPFVKIIVSGGSGAEMLCDSPESCPTAMGTNANFGERFAIDDSVSLSAIVPSPSDDGQKTVHLNVFTDLASSLTESLSGGINQENLSQANGQVADLFGVVSDDLISISGVNLADADASESSADELRAALVSGGAMSALFEQGSNLGAALNGLRADFIAQNGQLIVNEDVDEPSVISLEDIYGGASDLISMSALQSESLRAAGSQILGDALIAAGEDIDTLSNASPSPTSDSASLDKAKAFVSDLQLAVQAVNSDDNEEKLTNFADRVEDAAKLIAADTDDEESVFEAALEALTSFSLAYEAYKDDNTITTFEDEDVVFKVSISGSGDNLTLAISDQTFFGNKVSLSIVGPVDLNVERSEIDESSTTDDSYEAYKSTKTFTLSGDATISGQVENSVALMSIIDGEAKVVEATGLHTIDDSVTNNFRTVITSNYDEDITISITDISADFKILIKQKETELKFEGLASGQLKDVALSQSDKSDGNYDYSENYFERSLELSRRDASVSAVDLGISGTLSDGGESVDVTFGFKADGEAVSVSDKAISEDLFHYSVSNNELTLPNFESTDILSLLEFSAAQAEIAALNEVGEINGIKSYRDAGVETGQTTTFAAIPTSSSPVLKIVVKSNDSNDRTKFTLFMQPETKGLFSALNGDPRDNDSDFETPVSESFIANPPTDIIEYVNGFFSNSKPFLTCSNINGPAKIYLVDPLTPLKTGGGTIRGSVLRDQTGQVFICEDFFAKRFTALTGQNEVEVDPAAAATGLVSASIQQNIVGIDPDDPVVFAKLFGPVAYQDEDAVGNLTLQIDFAGRRFKSNARDVDIFEDLSKPITVTNQDNVVMTISEDDTTSLATGNVTVDGKQQATITEDNNIVLVNFKDGTFVSLK